LADLIIACARRGHPPFTAERLRRAALRLAPPEVPARAPLLLETGGVVAAVANPTEQGVWLHGGEAPRAAPGGGVCVGGLFGATGGWWQTGAAEPDGTYALARWDEGTIELLADICASRTLWYVLTDAHFLASTSQRALVALLGSFELQPEAVASLLVTGTLGPEAAWDARIRRLPPDGRAILDRGAWRLVLKETPAAFAPAGGGAETAAEVARLRDAISTTCGSLNIDAGRWVLPLSGGCDSRALLAFLAANGLRPRCVTWTTRASLRNPLSDASIARALARRHRLEHELLFLDGGYGDLETALARFVAANEGRNDEITGYLDGFALWRDLAASGVQGVIRGDESFGPRLRPMQPDSGRRQVGGAVPGDYPAGHLVRTLDLAPQTWPPRLHKAADENLRDYRARLSQHGYVPIILAGLNAAKSRYVEVVNPHLSRLVITTVRSLPPELRSYARAFAMIVDGVDRSLPYARFSSTLPAPDLLTSPAFLELVVRDLTAPAMERILGAGGALRVLSAMAAAASASPGYRARLKGLLKRAGIALPTRLADRVTPAWKGPEPLPPAKLALRAVLAGRTVALLEEDALGLAVTEAARG